jgi:hypothetical protein
VLRNKYLGRKDAVIGFLIILNVSGSEMVVVVRS